MSAPRADLPISPLLPGLAEALTGATRLVLEAPPGAGKTTRVPPALLGAPWLGTRKIVMLEPRRLAARAAAAFMARQLGEEVGETIGHRMRLDTKIGPKTRIEVVTEGVLTRMIQEDPALSDYGLVLFDEFHERSLNADLGLALTLDAQKGLREDLRLVVMSATLDGERLARFLGGAPLLRSEGRAFPVETRHIEPGPGARLEDSVAGAVRRALAEAEGSILVFLPGEGEIRRVASRLEESGLGSSTALAPLYGALAKEAQDAAIRPARPGTRKVVLATSIAETSLTIEGIRIVIDCGYRRVSRFDPRSGMTRLETVRISQAAAEQRRGRAGRLEPGICYRLWSEAATRGLAAFDRPEILEADLAPLALDLAQWGIEDPAALSWLDPPPAASLAQARDLLRRLDALDDKGKITGLGRSMAALPLHPRLAHMIAKGRELGFGGLACDIAALLSERDILSAAPGARDVDFRLRLDALKGVPLPPGISPKRYPRDQAREAARQWRRQLRIPAAEAAAEDRVGLALALAYPDRIGQRRGGDGQYRLANGKGAILPPGDPLGAEEFLAVADIDGGQQNARIHLAAPLARADIEEAFAEDLQERAFVLWDSREQAVSARSQIKLGELVLKDAPLKDAAPGAIQAALLSGIREMGLGCLPWTKEIESWRRRVAFLRRIEGETWPDLSDEALLAGLEDWLLPYLSGMSRKSHLERLDLAAALAARLDWPQQKALDASAPSHLQVPSGSNIAIDYGEDPPVLAVRLQEMFGLAEGPKLARGKVAVKIHLLSPAQRPIQVTQDLASFWKNTYPQVKAEMKGRYPKHVWPDDPMAAVPTRRAKPRGT